MKARKFLLAGMAFGLALTVASCGNGKREANYIVPEELDVNQSIEIEFYHTMGTNLQAILNTAIEKFHSDYPNFTVNAQQIGNYDAVRNQISTEIPQGLEPHIAYCYPDHVALYNRANAVVQLDNLINDSKYGFTKDELADFIPGYWEEGKQFGDDLMYTVPFSKSTEVLYYNKTVFEENGWDVPKTWQEMMTLCSVIKNAKGSDGNSTKYPNVLPLGIDSEANLFITLCEQTGSKYTSATGDHFLFDNAENRSYVQSFVDWYKEGLYTTQTILTTYTSSLFTAYDPAKIGTDETKYSFMSIGSTGGAAHQYPSNGSFEVGVAPIPTWGNVDLKVISQGPSLCFFNKANPQEVLASWIFVKDYLLDTDFQAAFSNASGYNPVLNSTYTKGNLPAKNMTYQEWLDSGNGKSSDGLAALTAKKSSEFVENYFTSPAFNGSSKARDQVGALFVAAVTGTDLDKAFKDAMRECED